MAREKAHNEEKEPFLEKILSRFRYRKVFGRISNNFKVLDLGCGYNAGFLRLLYNKKKCECFGLDISVNEAIICPGLTLVKHDLNLKFPFKENSFDVVVSLANLEHLENPIYVLREIQRVLKPNGRVFLTTPSIYARPILEFLAFRLHFLSENEIKDHKNYFCKKTLVRMLKETGFISIGHRYFQFWMNNFVEARKL